MEKYTVLLVDDEEEVIQVIMKKINWEGLGFSVIGYANNGVKALEMLSRKLNDALSSRLFYAHFDSHRDISHFKSSCFCELFF